MKPCRSRTSTHLRKSGGTGKCLYPWEGRGEWGFFRERGGWMDRCEQLFVLSHIGWVVSLDITRVGGLDQAKAYVPTTFALPPDDTTRLPQRLQVIPQIERVPAFIPRALGIGGTVPPLTLTCSCFAVQYYTGTVCLSA
ncbi:unnamed protein product [Tuber melanosporum]|uniref:(Perigord truffle) hypothetical protein n=1 Tax=Tuber melanosporum (strain Mel28) TaxID=656061 RepID=D5G4D5_TUBMM|nr:uncharacterized protein GSTUM_00004061001 [Tuber melanosporum]CAZ79378.1 unnamed protein product [Tuber melanosporum]